jgi:hypothetical protein
MKLISGTRYGLPDDDRGACKLDDGDTVKVSLEGFFKGWMCVGVRKVSCIFFQPVGPGPWVYCSKSRFLDIVEWTEFHGHDFHTEFNLQYNAGGLIPLMDSELPYQEELRRMAVVAIHGLAKGSA